MTKKGIRLLEVHFFFSLASTVDHSLLCDASKLHTAKSQFHTLCTSAILARIRSNTIQHRNIRTESNWTPAISSDQ
ncbi:hypothetical protein C1H46_026498 [Malus baccata]|uniref:Secreted protein n=1 Tax=Malus baccata TaxID=106549 RepID=A0A540LN77_MALBA|nr:hypothetical protein C1H46_026498 [Malus baccata]